MHTLGIVGPGATDLVERLAGRLDGRVVTVESFPSTDAPLGAPDTDSAYGLADNGSWIGAGGDTDLDALLDDLAPDTDYLLVAGFPDADLPTVRIVGDTETADASADTPAETEADGGGAVVGEIVAEIDDPADADLDTLVETLHTTDPYVTLGSLVAEIKRHPDAERSGAIATFTGRVRARDGEDDDRTTALEFETYEGVADQRMATISEELETREGVHAVRMHHRTGYIADGEDIVFVVVLAGHRREAFRTVEDGIDRLKDEVPIFKREITVDGEFWVHDRE